MNVCFVYAISQCSLHQLGGSLLDCFRHSYAFLFSLPFWFVDFSSLLILMLCFALKMFHVVV
jgi:uncharacterized protein YggT (Ycf19 family)